MREINFDIDPSMVREAVLSGRLLHVQIHGDKLQYKKVTITHRKAGPITPSDEAQARAA